MCRYQNCSGKFLSDHSSYFDNIEDDSRSTPPVYDNNNNGDDVEIEHPAPVSG